MENVLIWQFIQVYKEEALNPIHKFNETQQKKLLDLMEISEKNYKSIRPRKINKSNMAFHNYDKKFIEYGGDMDLLADKVDEVYSKIDNKIYKVAEAAMRTPQLLKKLRLKKPE